LEVRERDLLSLKTAADATCLLNRLLQRLRIAVNECRKFASKPASLDEDPLDVAVSLFMIILSAAPPAWLDCPANHRLHKSMNSKIFPIFLLPVGISLLASCYPIPDEPATNQQGEQTITSDEQQKIQEQRDRMREEAERREREQQAQQPTERLTSPPPPPPPSPRSPDYPFATPVPGKEGLVFSPYNNKVVDVRDIPSGTLVQDPTYPPADKKFFRVP